MSITTPRLTWKQTERYEKAIVILLIAIAHLVFWPYNGMGGDMIEIIPGLKMLSNPGLYPRDFYQQFTSHIPWHERSFYLYFLHLTGGQYPWLLWCYYLICLLFMITGLYRISEKLIPDPAFAFLNVIVVMFCARYFSVGGNELFYSSPTSAIFAKTAGIWAIYFFLNQKMLYTGVLCSIAVCFHILAGAQLAFLLMASGAAYVFLNQKHRRLLTWLLLPAPFIAAQVWAIVHYRMNPHTHASALADLIEFRIGHHFFIEYSGWLNIVLYGAIFCFSLWWWRLREQRLFYFTFFQVIGLVVYIWLSSCLHNEIALQSQWLKSSIWVEFFGITAILSAVSNYIQFPKDKYYAIGLVSIVIGGLLIASLFTKKEDPASLADEQKLASWALTHTRNDALFVYPPSFTRFKSIAERSSWIDYKAIAHQTSYLVPWSDRVQRIYGINLDDRRSGANLIQLAEERFEKINDHNLTYLLFDQKVDYIILPTLEVPSEYMFPACTAGRYTIYQRKELN